MGNKDDDLADQQRKARLSSLEQRLAKSRAEDAKQAAPSTGKPGYGNALKMSSEFISAILVGALIGYLIDTFAGTTPWAMIIMLLLGFVAGVLNVLRSTGSVADPYQAGWVSKPDRAKDQKGSKKAPDDLYDDDD